MIKINVKSKNLMLVNLKSIFTFTQQHRDEILDAVILSIDFENFTVNVCEVYTLKI